MIVAEAHLNIPLDAIGLQCETKDRSLLEQAGRG